MTDHHDKSIYQSGDDATALVIYKSIFWTGVVIFILFAVYHFMDRPETPQQLTTLHYECGPAMEMDMPVDLTRL
jgi:hypothetical protein